MYVANEDVYVSKKEFKKLEKKVEHMLEIHKGDDELTEDEKKLFLEAEADLKKKKPVFTPVDEL